MSSNMATYVLWDIYIVVLKDYWVYLEQKREVLKQTTMKIMRFYKRYQQISQNNDNRRTKAKEML